LSEASGVLDGVFLRRVVLPGAVVTSYVHPYLRGWLVPVTQEQYGLEVGLVLLAEAVLYGLLLSSAILPIFQVYEGFSLTWLTKWAEERNRKRLAGLEQDWIELKRLREEKFPQKLSNEEKNRERRILAGLEDFPIEGEEGETGYVVEQPTRLGNIMAGYERYPETRYGFFSITFWYHLVFLAPEAARKAFEEGVAFADSMVLSSAAGVVVFLLAAGALLGRLVYQITGLALVRVPLGFGADIAGVVGGLLAWVLFYQLALPAHRKVGALFRALTDLTARKLGRYLEGFGPEAAKSAEDKANKFDDYTRFLRKR
jgi:hypothetical protein